MYFYINLYFFFSMLGYVFEEILMFILNKPYNSSVLYGPWTSVYGIAVYIMLIVYYFISRLNFNKLKEKIVYFLSISVILTILEGISGYIIEKTKHVVYWNYDKYKFNIGHYMSLESSIMWGILAIISIYYIVPKIKKMIKKVPKIITILLLIMYIVDIVISSNK